MGVVGKMKNGAVITLFFHPKCFKRPSTLTSLDDLELLDDLTREAKQEIQDVLDKPSNKKRKKNKSKTNTQ